MNDLVNPHLIPRVWCYHYVIFLNKEAEARRVRSLAQGGWQSQDSNLAL